METKANFIFLGTATLVGIVLIMAFSVWLADTSFRNGYDVYDVVFDDPVRGLAEGGEVRFNGIKVGEVQTLRIDPDNTNRVIARIRVSAAIPLREDSRAQLEPIGLTGVTLIQLSAGSPVSPLLQQSAFGGPPQIQGSGSQIDIIVERGQDVVVRASEAMAAVRDLLTDENIARVNRILANLESISGKLAQDNSLIDRGAVAVTQVGDAAADIGVLAEQLSVVADELNVAVVGMGNAVDTANGSTLPEITQAAEQLRDAAAAIERLATEFEESPSLLTPEAPRRTVELEP